MNHMQAPLVFGEVLYDHFPNGQRVLGGASFNVAWNLQGLGLPPLFVSAVGNDEEGNEMRRQMVRWEMETAGLQVSSSLPTGEVRVTVTDGEPSYEILSDRAYDDIKYPEGLESSNFSMLYHGSLALRTPATRSTLERLIDELRLPRFVDINIRQPWIDRELAEFVLRDATWVKLNRAELSWLLERDCQTAAEITNGVADLRGRYGGELHFITCGAEGSYVIDSDEQTIFASAPQPQPLVDAVGAGDAFAAAAILGICRGDPLEQTLKFALDFAARTCTIQGATTTNRQHYGEGDRTQLC